MADNSFWLKRLEEYLRKEPRQFSPIILFQEDLFRLKLIEKSQIVLALCKMDSPNGP
jgi:hypothetical protein